jgi:2-octaprenyl-6-methoxyphenol hydroxylase
MRDVIIIGSGLIGAAMAIALARAGLRVDLIDAAPTSSRLSTAYDGRTSAVALGSMRVLSHIGVWQRITDSEPIQDIRVCDEGGRFYVHYDHTKVGNEPFGHIVENRLLRQSLYEAVDEQKTITVHQPATVTSLESSASSVTVTLSNGESLQASLALVADGKFSKTRDMLGIDTNILTYGQTAIVCTIAHDLPHHGLAVEKFMPAGPFALLPMTNNRTNIVWSERDAMAARMLELDDSEFKIELRQRIGDHLGDFKLIGPRHSYPLILIHARRYTDKRVALIGDSAHGIHPIAGQGANLGFRDVAVLTELLLEQARLGLDLGSDDLLAHYQQWRRFDTLSMTSVTDALNRLFSNRILPLKLARDFGMGMVERLPNTKRFLMHHAMGLVGDLPSMMQDPNRKAA